MSLKQRLEAVLEVNPEDIQNTMQTPELVIKAYIVECDALIEACAEDDAQVEASQVEALQAKRDEARAALDAVRSARVERQLRSGDLEITGGLSFDTIGLHCDYAVSEALEKGATAEFRIVDLEGAPVSAVPSFSEDGSGDFHRVVLIAGKAFAFYVPLGALEHTSSGRYRLEVRVFAPKSRGGEELGAQSQEFSLPEPRPFSVEEVYGPLLRLMMTMVIADGVMEREELNLVQKFCKSFLRLERAQFPEVIKVLRAGPSSRLEEDIALVQSRFPHIPALVIIQMLAMICRVDGDIHENELKLCRKVAGFFGVQDAHWQRLVKVLRLERQPEAPETSA